MAIGGLSSGDFRLSNSALRILYSVIKDTVPSLASDAFTQSNPAVSTGSAATSTIDSDTVKKGVLGGSVAFLRPDVGNNTVGGPGAASTSIYSAGTFKALGLFMNDAVGNAYENTAAVASGKLAVLRGGSVGVKIYETAVLSTDIDSDAVWTSNSVSVGDLVTYRAGDHVYGSLNGLLTNRWQDSLEALQLSAAGASPTEAKCTRLGVVVAAPDATSAELFVALFL